MSKLPQPQFHGEITLADSSLIKAVKYDMVYGVLDVKLKSGQAYRYRQVSCADFTTLLTAKSAGQVYNENIKRTFYGWKRKATKLRSW